MADKYQYFDGRTFTRDEKTGYYLCSTASKDGTRKRMHVYVWEYYNGPIPNGYHIHHIDRNKSNNQIENLILLKESAHRKLHANTLTLNERERRKENITQRAMPKAKIWHGSEEGHEWHKNHYQRTKDKLHTVQKFICQCCGTEFESTQVNSKFCSNKCKSQYRRLKGIDNIEGKCVVCGKSFVKNKYSKKRTCSRECAAKLCVYNRNQIHW